MFTKEDLAFFERRGISFEEVQQQMKNFETGFPFLQLVAPATINKGIVRLNLQEQEKYINIFNSWQGQRIKFVPASGAATRMFKVLYEAIPFLESNTIDWADKRNESLLLFFKDLNKFAFFDELKQILEKQGKDITDSSDSTRAAILKALLMSDGMNYGSNPKGLLLFHKYETGNRTAVEEHLIEAGEYANDKSKIKLHFTVSPEHKQEFINLLEKLLPNYEKKYGVKYEISFSEQKLSTDTIAVTPDLKPFREEDNNILFRPAGHGALLENLNEIKEELIFIKNIDNVANDHLIQDTINWKKILAGYLLDVRNRLYNYMENLEQADILELKKIVAYVNTTFCTDLNENLPENELREVIRMQLDKPLRVCGMVKNEGEPGGGPFVVKDHLGNLSLQIAESSQINLNIPDQKEIFNASTHFNPVDLVCSTHNYKGEKYNLLKFRDPETGFISNKTKDGKELKAQELPGLWNGAMSNWNTIFVETPLSTFNPVKTVNDLLKKEHQTFIANK